MGVSGPEKRRSRGFTRALLWVGLAGAAFLVWHDYATRIRLDAAEESPDASPLPLEDLSGRAVQLADYDGRVVLVNVWASWCGPCRREIPVLRDLHERFAADGLVVLGLNVDRLERDEVAALVERWEVDYPVVVATGPTTGTFALPGAIPHSWLIDRRGRVRASHTGAVSARSLERACRQLLEEPAG